VPSDTAEPLVISELPVELNDVFSADIHVVERYLGGVMVFEYLIDGD
jgi:hypothetical protein